MQSVLKKLRSKWASENRPQLRARVGINTGNVIVGNMGSQNVFDYTDKGRLVGHITIGVEMLNEKIQELPDFPFELDILLKHLILSHHGHFEFGSPKRPKTLEAIALYYLDDLDAKIDGIAHLIDVENDNKSPWTSFSRLYERYFFKGKLIDADEANLTIKENEFRGE